MSRNIDVFNTFKRDAKKHYLHLISPEWAEVLNCLIEKKPLPAKYLDHALQGNLKAYRDCHVKNDLVLLYKIVDEDNTVELHFLDTHSEIFKKAK